MDIKYLEEPIGKMFNESGSDKQHYHFYATIYEWLINHLALTKKRKLTVLEIGISLFGPDGSFKVWQNHPLIEMIVGVDVEEYQGEITEPNQVLYGDAYNERFVEDLKELYPEGFDLVIDDGSHLAIHQIFVLDKYLQLCNDGGYLVVEDVFNEAVYGIALRKPNVFIIDTSWNHPFFGHKHEFDSRDHKLLVLKNEKELNDEQSIREV